jgi:hypothetical protein
MPIVSQRNPDKEGYGHIDQQCCEAPLVSPEVMVFLKKMMHGMIFQPKIIAETPLFYDIYHIVSCLRVHLYD